MKGAQITLNFTIRYIDLTFGDQLGQGAYGKVFAGEWKFNPVAIKQYAAQDFSEQTQNEILKEAEVMAIASTQSDYLVRLRGIVLEKPHYSLVMEYMPGGDLFHMLKSSQELTWPMRYRISLDMTIGLHHLHQQGILHRDFKSLNVLLDLNFRAKLADFGLSTLKTNSGSRTGGGFKGTLLWAAPELFKRGSNATEASDLYALAMVFWELITRRIPFADAPNPAIAIEWVKSGEQETIPDNTPEEFKAIILECWNKEPGQRPTAAIVAKRLDTLWQAERKQTSSPTPSSSSSSSSSSHSAPIPILMNAFEDKSAATNSQFNDLPPKLLLSLLPNFLERGVVPVGTQTKTSAPAIEHSGIAKAVTWEFADIDAGPKARAETDRSKILEPITAIRGRRRTRPSRSTYSERQKSITADGNSRGFVGS